MAKCECPQDASVNLMPDSWYREEELAGKIHTPGNCAGTYKLAKYRRGDQTLFLCSCCVVPGDVPVDEGK